MKAARQLGEGLLLGISALLLLGIGPCNPFGSRFAFLTPLPQSLTTLGTVVFDLRADLPIGGHVAVFFDGTPVPEADLTATVHGLSGSVTAATPGLHRLSAVFVPDSSVLPSAYSEVGFEAADLPNADVCEILNAAECLLPYPSSRFLADVGGATPTGYRIDLPQVGMPVLNGPPVSPDPINRFDGFSPTVQILMSFPQGVDLAASGAPVLEEARCCGHSSQTPFVGVRTYGTRSLDAGRRHGSPTLLLDADTGERVLHFVELDARAAGDPARQILFLRPAVSLVPGHRYIVAVRNLVDPNGDPVEPEPAFRVLRDGTPSQIPALEARRPHFEELFAQLRRARVARSDLVLAFDFVVRSDEQLTHEMLAMRDDALAWADANPLQVAMDFGFNAQNFHPDCADTGNPVWRRVRGTFTSPFYLTPNTAPDGDGYVGVQWLGADADGTPVRNGFHQVPFDILVPCSVLEPNHVVRPILIGHGLFGTGAGMIDGIVGLDQEIRDLGLGRFDYIAGATDWRGLSQKDLGFVATQVIGLSDNQLDNFPSFTARLKQGMVDTLVLAHRMKTGAFNAFGQFQRVPGFPATGVFPGSGDEMYYYGISLGGIMGLFFGALTPDLERMHIDVGAINFSLLLQRSTQFSAFESLLKGIGLVDPMQTALGLGLLHEIWVSSEPAGYVRHVTGLVEDPLPGATPKKLLFTAAWLDKQVSNQAQEIAARSLGLPNVSPPESRRRYAWFPRVDPSGGSLVAGLVDIPDVEASVPGSWSIWGCSPRVPPLNDACGGYFVWDTGSFDVFDPAYDAVIPPLANLIPSPVCDPHARRLTIPAAIEQQLAFLRPGGVIIDPCRDDGVCNASEAYERPDGEEAVCDPLAP